MANSNIQSEVALNLLKMKPEDLRNLGYMLVEASMLVRYAQTDKAYSIIIAASHIIAEEGS